MGRILKISLVHRLKMNLFVNVIKDLLGMFVKGQIVILNVFMEFAFTTTPINRALKGLGLMGISVIVKLDGRGIIARFLLKSH